MKREELEAGIESIIDAVALSVKTGYVVHPTKKVISKLHGRHAIMAAVDQYAAQQKLDELKIINMRFSTAKTSNPKLIDMTEGYNLARKEWDRIRQERIASIQATLTKEA